MTPEQKRKRVVTEVRKTFHRCQSYEGFERAMRRKYGKQFRYLGGGIDREVFALPQGLVVKLSYGQEQNNTERETYKEYPRLVAKVYAHLSKSDDGYWSINIQRRARRLRGVPRKNSKWNKAFRRIARRFHDVHWKNVGIIDERLVLIDGGFGSGYTSGYTTGHGYAYNW